jgi:hypothetical protein
MATPAKTFRLVAMDLDGTLAGPDGVISARTRDAIARAQARGVIVTLVTGRTLPAVRPKVMELGLTAPVILCNGASIYNANDGHILFRRPIASTLSRKIIRFLVQAKLSPVAFVDDGLYSAQTISPNISPRSGLAGMKLHILGAAFERFALAPEKIAVIVRANHARAWVKKLRAETHGKISLTRPYPTLIEMTHRYASKGRALGWLANHLKIPRRQVMAIGDGDNDMDMIQWAGMGVAMGNAPASVRAVSDYVADSVEVDGLAKVIERFILDGKCDHDT